MKVVWKRGNVEYWVESREGEEREIEKKDAADDFLIFVRESSYLYPRRE